MKHKKKVFPPKKLTPLWVSETMAVVLVILVGFQAWNEFVRTDIEVASRPPEVIQSAQPIEGQVYVAENVDIVVVFGYDGDRVAHYTMKWDVSNEKNTQDNIEFGSWKTNSSISIISNADGRVQEQYDFTFKKEGRYRVKARIFYSIEMLGDGEEERIKYLVENGQLEEISFDVVVIKNEGE